MNKLPLVFSLIFTDIKIKNKVILNSCVTVGVSGSIVSFQAVVGHFVDKYASFSAEIVLSAILLAYIVVLALTHSISARHIK